MSCAVERSLTVQRLTTRDGVPARRNPRASPRSSSPPRTSLIRFTRTERRDLCTEPQIEQVEKVQPVLSQTQRGELRIIGTKHSVSCDMDLSCGCLLYTS